MNKLNIIHSLSSCILVILELWSSLPTWCKETFAHISPGILSQNKITSYSEGEIVTCKSEELQTAISLDLRPGKRRKLMPDIVNLAIYSLLVRIKTLGEPTAATILN